MSFETFLKEVEKGLPSPVYLLQASDPFLHREAVEKIKGLVPEAERDFNFQIFDLSPAGEEVVTLGQILDVANTVSFFGSRRFTVFTGNLQKLPKKDLERLMHYLSNPAPDTAFVMLQAGALTRDSRGKFRALKLISLDLKGPEIPSWLKQRARTKGIEMSDEATDYLIEIIGSDLGLLSSEVEKLSLVGKKRIDVDDISEIVTGERLYSIFDLVNALRIKDAEGVFRIYKTLRETADDYGLIGALNWQYGRSLHAKCSLQEKEYFLRVFELLHGADVDIKSSGRTFPTEYLLVKLLRLKEAPAVTKGRSPFL
jgi:DNA polymerase-3 subunit delta